MACRVDELTRDVTFLYRFERGACLRSHGVNVARLAGLPQPLLDSAAERSALMERSTVGDAPDGAHTRTRARAAELARQLAAAAAALGAAREPAARDALMAELRALQAEARAIVG
jgi:DNA mismatch repair ATPase MutS